MNSVEVTSDDSDPRIELKKGNCNNSKNQHGSSVFVNIASGKATSEKLQNFDCIIPLGNFSGLLRLMRVTAYVLRFASNPKQSKMKKELIDGEVTQEEIDQAKDFGPKRCRDLSTTTRTLTRTRSHYHCYYTLNALPLFSKSAPVTS